MKKPNIYYSTILWAKALTTLVGCNYHTKNSMMDEKNNPSTSGIQEELVNELSNLSLDNSNMGTAQIIGILAEVIKGNIKAIDNEENFYEKKFLVSYITYLVELSKQTEEKETLNKNTWLHLPRLDYSQAPEGYKMELLNICDPWIDPTEDPELKNADLTYFRSIIDCGLRLPGQIAKIEEHKFMQDTSGLEQKGYAIEGFLRHQEKQNNCRDIYTMNSNRPIPKQRNRRAVQARKAYMNSEVDAGSEKIQFDETVDNIFYKTVLAQLVKILKSSIIYGLNQDISMQKSNSGIDRAQQKYNRVCTLINDTFNITIKNYPSALSVQTQQAKTYNSKRGSYSTTRIIHKLLEARFQIIKNNLDEVKKFINAINCDPKLKQYALKAVKLFNNLVSSDAAIDVLSDFTIIIQMYKQKHVKDNICTWANHKVLLEKRFKINLSKFAISGDNCTKQKIDRYVDEVIHEARNIA